MPTTAADRPRRGRGARRPSPPTGDERRAAILETAERLLGERPLRDVSIDDLARGAGISRPTFYFYFGSKDEVLLTLLEGVVAEADQGVMEGFEQLATDGDPAQWWRRALTAVYTAFSTRRAVTIAVAEAYAAGGEVRARWEQFIGRWVELTSLAITAERERGAAPDGLPAHELAVMLNAMNERVMLGTFGGFGSGVIALDEDTAVESILTVWLDVIYRGRDAG